jgi:hypothetical protein
MLMDAPFMQELTLEDSEVMYLASVKQHADFKKLETVHLNDVGVQILRKILSLILMRVIMIT